MRVFKQIIIWCMVMSAGWAQTPGTQSVINAETSAQLAEGKQTVAILDFEGRGISQMEAATLTDRLMSEMVSTNAVIMVERNQMNEILEEQGKMFEKDLIPGVYPGVPFENWHCSYCPYYNICPSTLADKKKK